MSIWSPSRNNIRVKKQTAYATVLIFLLPACLTLWLSTLSTNFKDYCIASNNSSRDKTDCSLLLIGTTQQQIVGLFVILMIFSPVAISFLLHVRNHPLSICDEQIRNIFYDVLAALSLNLIDESVEEISRRVKLPTLLSGEQLIHQALINISRINPAFRIKAVNAGFQALQCRGHRECHRLTALVIGLIHCVNVQDMVTKRQRLQINGLSTGYGNTIQISQDTLMSGSLDAYWSHPMER